LNTICAKLRNPHTARGDFQAQVSANRVAVQRVQSLASELGCVDFAAALVAVNEYAEALARNALQDLPEGTWSFRDVLDDDGLGQFDIPIVVRITHSNAVITVDFTGTSAQVAGNVNCPLSVAAAGVYYVFRCLMPEYTPAAAGAFRSIQVVAPEGCLLNAQRPAAVAAGNVETSSRVVDVVMGALAQAIPERMAAASQGSMNNLAMGAAATATRAGWDYYETMGGGMGASSRGDGLSARQTHMTNTRNTPVEVLEQLAPIRVEELSVRQGSGGAGEFQGGEGVRRRYRFLADAHATLLTERRRHAPWGFAEGAAGAPGRNALDDEILPSKVSLPIRAGQVLTVETPGGGGWGRPARAEAKD
jgi:N-methylhydantoinase B